MCNFPNESTRNLRPTLNAPDSAAGDTTHHSSQRDTTDNGLVNLQSTRHPKVVVNKDVAHPPPSESGTRSLVRGHTPYLPDFPLEKVLQIVRQGLECSLVVLLPLLHLSRILVAKTQTFLRHALEPAS